MAIIDSTTYTITKAVPTEITYDSRLDRTTLLCGNEFHYFDLQQHQWQKLQIVLPQSERKRPREQYCFYQDSSLLISSHNYYKNRKLIRIKGSRITQEGSDSVCGFKMPFREYGLVKHSALFCLPNGFIDGEHINILTPPKKDQKLFQDELVGEIQPDDLGHFDEYPIVKWHQGKCLYFLSNYGSKTEVCGRNIRYLGQLGSDPYCEPSLQNGKPQKCWVNPNSVPVYLTGDLYFHPKDSSKVYTNCFVFSRNSSSFYCPSANGLDTFPRTPDSAIKHSQIQSDPPLLKRQSP